MARILRLFTHITTDDQWEVVHAYGQAIMLTTATQNDTRVRSPTGDALLYTACAGKLSVKPPAAGWFLPTFVPSVAHAALPAACTLYLHVDPLIAMLLQFPLNPGSAWLRKNFLGWFYGNVESATLEPALGALLDGLTLNGAPLTRAQAVLELVNGNLDVPVTAGHLLGHAATVPFTTNREVGFAGVVTFGNVDPMWVYNELASFVEEEAEIAEWVALLGIQWPLIDPALPNFVAMPLTGQATYPYAVLDNERVTRGYDAADWRAIGNVQKSHYLERLMTRSGHGTGTLPFEFNDADRKNIFQLEAVIEFYNNFDDPWAAGAVPLATSTAALQGVGATAPAVGAASSDWVTLPAATTFAVIKPNHDLIYLADARHPTRTYRITEVDAAANRVRIEGEPGALANSTWRISRYQVTDLLDPAGSAATLAGTVLTLDGSSDLTRVWPSDPATPDVLYDWIELDDVTGTSPARIRIVAVNPEARTVELESAPTLSGASTRWRIILRPRLIVIDPFGPRLQGPEATVPSPASPTIIELDASAVLDEVNANFDTIYLPADTTAGKRTYRIIGVDIPLRRLELDRAPSLPAPSPWHIQSGVSGVLPYMGYGFAAAPSGYDHFDGMLFLVHRDQVQYTARWNSYTSRDQPAAHPEYLSTVRGNKLYEFTSFRSTNAFRNYSLKVVDYGALARSGIAELFDGVREARFYFANPPTPDIAAPNVTPDTPGVNASANGKTVIRFHHSGTVGTGCSSAGCIVSSNYAPLRQRLTVLYNDERALVLGARDTDIDDLETATHGQAEALWNANTVTDAEWNRKIVGYVWIIRPDERSL